MTFNATCAFPATRKVVSDQKSKMTERFTVLRTNSSALCDKERRKMRQTDIEGKLKFSVVHFLHYKD